MSVSPSINRTDLRTAWAAERSSARAARERGNTGGADVSAFRPMPIPADLASLLGVEAGR